MNKRKSRRIIAIMILSIMLSGINTVKLYGATDPGLSKARVHFSSVNQKKTVRVLGLAKNNINSVSIRKTDKSIVKVQKKSNTKLSLTSVGIGVTTVRIHVRLKNKVRNKKAYSFRLEVSVGSNGNDVDPTSAPAETGTAAPASPVATSTPSSDPQSSPSATSKPGATPFATVPKKYMNVGETMPITLSEGFEPEYVISNLANTKYSDAIEIDPKTNVITAKKAGIVYVMVIDLKTQRRYDIGEFTVYDNKSPYISFYNNDIRWLDDGRRFKVEKASRADYSSGYLTCDFLIQGTCSFEELKKHLKVTAEDVTPVAYTRVLYPMGMSGDTLEVSIGDENKYSKNSDRLYANAFDDSKDIKSFTPTSAVFASVKASYGVRDIKLTASWDGKAVDVLYTSLVPCDKDALNAVVKTNSMDKQLCVDVRHRVEEKLWTSDMSNLDKLGKLAKYISATTHYPGSAATNSKTNPVLLERAKDYIVDNISNHLVLFTTPELAESDALLGGAVADCTVVTYIAMIAREDLNIPAISKGTRDHEGVYVGVGEDSTAPYNPGHYTLWYVSPEGKAYGIDAQGQKTPCSVHHCENYFITL